MKSSKKNNVQWAIGMFAALIATAMVISATSVVMAQSAEVPTLEVGDSAYFGGIVDAEDYKEDMNAALEQYEEMGIDVTYNVNGGAGAYMGWEVASNDADVNGYTCYDLNLMGALAIDASLDASVKGDIDMGDYGGTISIDGSGDAFVKFEAKFVDSHMYPTVDELAIAKIVLKVTAEGSFGGNIDATVDMGDEMKMKVDASGSIDDVEVSVTMEFNPPIDMYDFPIELNDEWYVPAEDTEMTVTKTAKGTITYDIEGTMTGEDPIDESGTENIADLIGEYLESTTIPGGEPENYYGYEFGGGTLFECTEVNGDIFIIEMPGLMDDMGGIDLGTRQSFLDPTSMLGNMPSMGLAFDKNKGMFTGMAMDGEVMTESVDEAEVESFMEDPQGAVVDETGGSASSGSSMLLPLLLVVVIVVVVVVVVVMMSKKKKAPATQGPQEYAPQPGYQQPPPQYPPQQPPQDGQYQQYPPPPPQGQ